MNSCLKTLELNVKARDKLWTYQNGHVKRAGIQDRYSNM